MRTAFLPLVMKKKKKNSICKKLMIPVKNFQTNAMLHERASVSPYSRRRLTRDWRILAEDVEDNRTKCTTRRKTFVGEEICFDSAIDLQNLIDNNLDFVTGSSYQGQCSKTGMDGYGIYTFPHGVVYEGQFRDGMFHGDGLLIYPQGQTLSCTFQRGKMTRWEFLFAPPKRASRDEDFNYTDRRSWGADSLDSIGEYEINMGNYCKPPDRRFLLSHSKGLRAAPKENLTNVKPTRTIPKGCYDVGDGFYNPKTKWVHRADDMTSFLYMIPEKERKIDLSTDRAIRSFSEKIPCVPIYRSEKWIKERCRKAWDENVGYKPNLFEYWFSGRREERENLNMRYVKEGGKFVEEHSINEECLKSFQIPLENTRFRSE